MTERTNQQAQIDPWATVTRFDMFVTQGYDLDSRPDANGEYLLAIDVDVARAADAAQIALDHRSKVELWQAKKEAETQIASLAEQVEQLQHEAEADNYARELEVKLASLRAQLAECYAERDNQYQQAVEATQRALQAEAERDLLKRGIAYITWGDADAVIAALVAERDAAQQESKTLDILLSQASQASMLNRRDYLEEHDKLTVLEQENQTLRQALTQLRDCDWTIGRGDRMDAVRDIARAALASRPQEPQL